MKSDNLGDRQKEFEMIEAGRKSMPLLPILARLDGVGFSRFTKGLKRPFDGRLSDLMIATTEYLVKQTNANCGYTQSDEITLTWYPPSYKSEIWFGGRFQKMNSVLSAKASVFFSNSLPKHIPEKKGKAIAFDCRVWNVPTLEEGANAFLWREQDATKNSVSMAARELYSHKELHLQGRADMMEMLFAKGVNWNDYPTHFKRGTYVQRKVKTESFSAEELEKLPEKHHARQNPSLVFQRASVEALELPKLSSILNRVDVIYFGAKPNGNVGK